MNTKEIFAQRIIELRKEKGITQAQLAERVCVSKTSANLYESATRVPDIQVLARYAKELGVTSDYLLGLSNNRTAETAEIGDKLGLSDKEIVCLTEMNNTARKLEAQIIAEDATQKQVDEFTLLQAKRWLLKWFITETSRTNEIAQSFLDLGASYTTQKKQQKEGTDAQED